MRCTSFIFGVLLGIITFHVTANAQQAVSINPAEPEAGDEVVITYDTKAPGAAIKNADSLNLVFSYSSFYELPDQLPMEQNGSMWTASWTIPEYANFASFYFDSGSETDKNEDGHHYEMMVFKNNKPVKGAYIRRAVTLGERYNDEEKIESLQIRNYEKELEYYPDDFLTRVRLLNTTQEDGEDKEELISLIEEHYRQNPQSNELVSEATSAYRMIGEEEKSDSLRSAFIENNPESKMAINDLYGKVRDMEHSSEKLDLLRKLENHISSQSRLHSVYQMLFDYYEKEDNTEKMKKYADKIADTNYAWKARTYGNFAEIFADNGNIDWALDYAQKALDAVEDEPVGPMYYFEEHGYIEGYTDSSVKENRRKTHRSNALAVLGYVQLKKGNLEEAEETLDEATTLADNNIDALKYKASLFMKTDRPREAFDIYWKILMEKPTDEEAREKLKESYVAYNQSDTGFSQKTEALDKAWREQMIEKFEEERLDKETPSLAGIVDLEGDTLDTAMLNGKVVVIDFWATWCGPCISAFPYLQNVYEKFEDNPHVEFIVLNSAWSNDIEDAKEWEQENDYTFPLYFDEDSKITDAFGVRGIPTTFVLGPKGNIQFKKVGFEGPNMEPKLALQIEMLLPEASEAKVIPEE